MTFKKYMKSHNLYLKHVGHKGGIGLFLMTKRGVVDAAAWYDDGQDKEPLQGRHRDLVYDHRAGNRKTFVPTL